MQHVSLFHFAEKIPVCILAADEKELMHFHVKFYGSPRIVLSHQWYSLTEAEKCLPYLLPCVLLVSYHFDGNRGYNIARHAADVNKGLHIAGYSFHYLDKHLFSMMHAGALSFFTQETGGEELHVLVEDAFAGRKHYNKYYSAQNADELKAYVANGDLWWKKELDDDTIAVAKAAYAGLSYKEAATNLKKKKSAIEYLHKKAKQDYHLRNGHDLVRLVIREGKMEA